MGECIARPAVIGREKETNEKEQKVGMDICRCHDIKKASALFSNHNYK